MSEAGTLSAINNLLKGYNGNKNLKRVGEQVSFTEDNVNEWIKCKDDPVYFVNNYCKIISLDDGLIPFKTFGYQDKIINAFHTNRHNIIMMSRQQGKCVGNDTIINIKQKSTNKEYEISIGDFYKWQSFVRWFNENIEQK